MRTFDKVPKSAVSWIRSKPPLCCLSRALQDGGGALGAGWGALSLHPIRAALKTPAKHCEHWIALHLPPGSPRKPSGRHQTPQMLTLWCFKKHFAAFSKRPASSPWSWGTLGLAWFCWSWETRGCCSKLPVYHPRSTGVLLEILFPAGLQKSLCLADPISTQRAACGHHLWGCQCPHCSDQKGGTQNSSTSCRES